MVPNPGQLFEMHITNIWLSLSYSFASNVWLICTGLIFTTTPTCFKSNPVYRPNCNLFIWHQFCCPRRKSRIPFIDQTYLCQCTIIRNSRCLNKCIVVAQGGSKLTFLESDTCQPSYSRVSCVDLPKRTPCEPVLPTTADSKMTFYYGL